MNMSKKVKKQVTVSKEIWEWYQELGHGSASTGMVMAFDRLDPDSSREQIMTNKKLHDWCYNLGAGCASAGLAVAFDRLKDCGKHK